MNSGTRQSYLDWLRFMAIIGVLLFHSAMPFAAEETWHIKNNETSNLFLEFNFWLSRFRMPLLFFISGAVCYFMLLNKSAGKFMGLRFRRLFIPLIAGMLIIIPPQVYMERLNQGFTGNYFDFYPSIFEGNPYPAGNTSWHHLWFILYLFIYDLISIPFFVWMISDRSKIFREKLNWFGKNIRIYLFMIPSIVVYAALILRFPQTNDLLHDFAMLPYWYLFMLFGFIIISQYHLIESVEKNRKVSLLMAVVSMICINYLRWNDREPFDTIINWRNDWRTYAYLSFFPLSAWCWLLALVGYARRYINRKHSLLNYINEAVYPFYILHQTIIVILAYYVVQVRDSILLKYTFITVLTLMISVFIFHLLIRPYEFMRFLFGMKRLKKEYPQTGEPVSVNEAYPSPVSRQYDFVN